MKQLAIKFVIFCILLVGIDKSYGLLMDKIFIKTLDYPMGFFNGYGKIAYTIDEDIVIFGDSKATHGIIPSIIEDSLRMSCINASKDGAGFLVQNYLVNKMLDRYSPKLIIWEWDAISLSNYMYDDEMDRMTDLVPFYGSDSNARDLVNRRSQYECVKLLSSIYRWNGKASAFVDILRTRNTEDANKGYAPLKSKHDKVLEKRVIHFKDDLDLSRVESFQNTINRIKEKGIHLIVISSPQFEDTNLEKTIQGRKLEQMLSDNNIIYFNHHFDERYLHDERNFFDPDHIDAVVAPEYTKMLASEIKKVLSDN